MDRSESTVVRNDSDMNRNMDASLEEDYGKRLLDLCKPSIDLS